MWICNRGGLFSVLWSYYENVIYLIEINIVSQFKFQLKQRMDWKVAALFFVSKAGQNNEWNGSKMSLYSFCAFGNDMLGVYADHFSAQET